MSHFIRSQLSLLVGALLLLLLCVSMTPLPAVPVGRDIEITNSIGMKFVLIPAGKFIMGSPKDEKDRLNDETQHEVTISKPFYLGVYTVTVGQFRQFVKDTGYKTEAEKDEQGGFGYNTVNKDFELHKKCNWQNVGWNQTDDHPVVNVTWNDAVAFSDWLSKKEGKEYQLPTEAQWEYACRAGTKTRFYSGDEVEPLKGVANIADASLKQKVSVAFRTETWDDGYPFTAPVGKFKPNIFGLFDMHGNVWQWCADWHGEYPQDAVTDPQGPETGEHRVLRGGSFLYNAVLVRSACRSWNLPSLRTNYIGFRVARTFTP